MLPFMLCSKLTASGEICNAPVDSDTVIRGIGELDGKEVASGWSASSVAMVFVIIFQSEPCDDAVAKFSKAPT